MNGAREDLERDDERDPRDDGLLAELRDAWTSVPAADPERGADDAASRAVAAWVRGAWDALEAPAAPDEAIRALVLRARRPRPVERVTPLVAWVGLAAAAALVVWLALADAVRDDVDGRDGVDVALAPPPTDQDTPGSSDLAPIVVEDVTPERMELRSGPVRLVLLNEWTETTGTGER